MTRPRHTQARALCGVGLGLRWEFLDDVLEGPPLDVAFLEVSPENYMRRGGYFPEALERLRGRYPLVSHGLTLSVGARRPPGDDYLDELHRELHRLGTPWHSDHLCASSAGANVLHELLPLAFTDEAAARCARHITHAAERLDLPMAIENVSYYAHCSAPQMSEAEFIGQVTERADCGLLLDVNNVYVNAVNHGYDPRAFIRALPLERVVEVHVAGHTRLPEDHLAAGLLLDTHGAPVADAVSELLRFTLELTGPVPVLLERDNDVPPLDTLLREVASLRELYAAAVAPRDAGPSAPGAP